MQFVLKALTRVPLWVLYTWGTVIYWITFHVVRWHRDRTERDIARALPEKTPAERNVIVRDSYRHLADIMMEALWGFGASAAALKQRVVIHNAELITRAIAEEQSVILLTAHQCNWEWQSLAAGAQFDIVIDTVYQPIRVEAVDKFFREARGRFGSRFIPRKEFIFDLMSHAGQQRTYALLADQTPKGKDPRHWTPFLHQETAFFVGAGKIARFLDAKVLYVSMRRLRRGYYSMDLKPLAEPPYDDAADTMVVEAYARALEEDIRASPADWLWVQNKWKYKRPVTSYAKPAARSDP